MKLQVKADIKKNRIYFTFAGKVSKQEMEILYTDTRFCVADMKPGFDVISDYSDCFMLYISGISPFRKIMNYLITNNVGEIVRVVNKGSLLYKQITNLSSIICGYKPIYASSLEEAEEKLNLSVKRNGIRFNVKHLHAEYLCNGNKKSGDIVNISTSGCSISSKLSELLIDKDVLIKFSLNKKDETMENFEIQSKTIRVNDDTFAVKFKNISNEQKEHLWQCLILESQRGL